jgi:two-component system, NtrC family, sensor kinase
MRKTFIKIIFLLLVPGFCEAQQSHVDSLRRRLKTAKTDSARFVALKGLGDHYVDINVDTALLFINEAIAVAKKNQQWLDVAIESDWKANQLLYSDNNLPEAYRVLQAAVVLADDPSNNRKTWTKNKKLNYEQYRLYVLANLYEDFGHLAGHEGNPKAQLLNYLKARSIAAQSGDKIIQWWLETNLADFYIGQKLPDSALTYTNASAALYKQIGEKKYLGLIAFYRAEIYSLKGDSARALRYYHAAAHASFENDKTTLARCYDWLASYFLSSNQPDSGLFYSQKLLKVVRAERLQGGEVGAYQLLYKSYLSKNNRDSAFKYLQLSYDAVRSNANSYIKSLADVQRLSLRDQLRLQELEKEKAATQTRIRTYALSTGIAMFMLLTGIFYRNNRHKQKVNHLLTEQKEEIETQRDNLGEALDELKATQTQLIQSEKMASLGELTAGIAHEIQNPLNFVNNFSDVNREMLIELKAESTKPKAERDEQLEMELIDDLIDNEQKINHHGKRADAIVKGMLQHSRSSSGQKEPTDLSALADEYLRLSYHGLRAKDKNFNADLVTHFDDQLPKVNVIPQDIGRVLLNLFNNAFYAVSEKAKTAGADYKPEVSVSTSAENGQVIIKVKDNGTGIPDAIKEKIMQPFFTTKPTGEGTGLGLSLSYDIVVKGHGGTIQVNSVEGEGSELVIQLPIS